MVTMPHKKIQYKIKVKTRTRNIYNYTLITQTKILQNMHINLFRINQYKFYRCTSTYVRSNLNKPSAKLFESNLHREYMEYPGAIFSTQTFKCLAGKDFINLNHIT